MNYKANIERAVANGGGDFVLSYKPNPAVLAETRWRPEIARAELEQVLDRARGCCVELIMKDISTVGYDPRRLWEWAELAVRVAEAYAP